MIILTDAEPRKKANPFVSPAWVAREIEEFTRQSVGQAHLRRILELRESMGIPTTVTGLPVGDTVHVRIPQRFSVTRVQS